MELSIREAAALLGRSPRTVRSRIAAGELRAKKHGKQWRVDSTALPMTDAQRQALQRRHQTIAEAVASVLPSPLAASRSKRTSRSVRDLEAFRALRTLCRTITAVAAERAPELRSAARLLRRGLLCLSAAEQEFAPHRRRVELLHARAAVGRGLAALLVDGDEATVLPWCDQLEAEVLRPIGGLLHWTEKRLPGGPPGGFAGDFPGGPSGGFPGGLRAATSRR